MQQARQSDGKENEFRHVTFQDSVWMTDSEKHSLSRGFTGIAHKPLGHASLHDMRRREGKLRLLHTLNSQWM